MVQSEWPLFPTLIFINSYILFTLDLLAYNSISDSLLFNVGLWSSMVIITVLLFYNYFSTSDLLPYNSVSGSLPFNIGLWSSIVLRWSFYSVYTLQFVYYYCFIILLLLFNIRPCCHTIQYLAAYHSISAYGQL